MSNTINIQIDDGDPISPELALVFIFPKINSAWLLLLSLIANILLIVALSIFLYKRHGWRRWNDQDQRVYHYYNDGNEPIYAGQMISFDMDEDEECSRDPLSNYGKNGLIIRERHR